MKFIVSECGNDAHEAFNRAKENAGISEEERSRQILKMDGFAFQQMPQQNQDAREFVDLLFVKIDMQPSNICLCVPAGGGEYIFFGNSID